MINNYKHMSLQIWPRLKRLARIALKDPRRLAGTVRRKLIRRSEQNRRFSTNIEVSTLCRYAQAAKEGIIEIGVLDGGTTREIGLFSRAPIYGIDPLIGDSMDNNLIGNEAIIRRNMAFYPRFRFFRDYSYHLARDWREPFDLLWIDGDHRYEAVARDFADWFPKLTSGGIVAFHDSAPVTSIPGSTHQGYAGPIRLVAELKLRPDLEFLETADSVSVFRKK
jgi:hypothetical protein